MHQGHSLACMRELPAQSCSVLFPYVRPSEGLGPGVKAVKVCPQELGQGVPGVWASLGSRYWYRSQATEQVLPTVYNLSVQDAQRTTTWDYRCGQQARTNVRSPLH